MDPHIRNLEEEELLEDIIKGGPERHEDEADGAGDRSNDGEGDSSTDGEAGGEAGEEIIKSGEVYI